MATNRDSIFYNGLMVYSYGINTGLGIDPDSIPALILYSCVKIELKGNFEVSSQKVFFTAAVLLDLGKDQEWLRYKYINPHY